VAAIPKEPSSTNTAVTSTFLDPAATRERAEPASAEEAERCLRQEIEEPLRQAAQMGPTEIVVGIPFYNEAETIASVLQTVREGLEEFYPGQKSIIVLAGSPAGSACLGAIGAVPQSEAIGHIAFLLRDERVNGRGWAIRSAMEIARAAGADLAIVDSDQSSAERNGETVGLSPDWVSLLLEPIRREKMDLVAPRFDRHYLESPTSEQLVYPLLASIYDCPVRDVLGGQWGISHRLLRTYLEVSFSRPGAKIGGYGIDVWLATRAAANGARICESNLGIKLPGASGKRELVLRHTAETLFESIVADRERWVQEEVVAATPFLSRLPAFGAKKAHRPEATRLNARELVSKLQRGLAGFRGLYEAVLPYDTHQQLETLAMVGTEGFSFSANLWAAVVYHFLLAFAFGKEFAKGDLISAFVPLFEGRLAGITLETQSLRAKLTPLRGLEAEELVSLRAERQVEALVDEFALQKPNLLAKWEISEEALRPPVPRVTYREFIPGVHLVVPLEVTSPEGYPVSANAIYELIFSRYTAEFDDFVYGKLGVSREAESPQIVRRIQDFLLEMEGQLDSVLLPGDLSTVAGTRQVVAAILGHFARDSVFALAPEMALRILRSNPPSSLLTRLGYGDLPAVLKEYESNGLLAMAHWSEEQEYQEWAGDLIRQEIRHSDLQPTALEPVVVSNDQFPSLVEMRECGGLCKLAGRVVVSNLRKGMGGQFPKLRYLTGIAKTIVEMERFGQIWRRWADEVRGFGDRLVNSLEGHWGREPLSAHSIFENGHQRVLVRRVRELSQKMAETAGDDDTLRALAQNLQILADSYHLAMIQHDGTLISCSAWSWASYSFKGGLGLPPPLSLHVERDWSSHDFLEEYLRASGGKEAVIDEKIAELMEQGREWEDLAPILLGTAREADAIMQMEPIIPGQAPARNLARFDGNPVLRPIEEHPWESKYVLNPGAIRLRGKIYLLYRAVGGDGISRLGLAVSEDGFRFTQRLEKPVFAPEGRSEAMGCEDPRLTLIGDRVFMLYTAYDGTIAQIGMASIEVDGFVNHRWQAWRRHGMVFPGSANKDGALFPEQFNGKYAMLHRVDPHIWITFSPHLRCPWPRTEHEILAGATYGMLWEGKKIGAGAQPIKTRYGWLLITHGVDYLKIYRLGVLLLDLLDPTVVIYRSPNPVLEPASTYEVGEPDRDWVPNVVFTCGAVPMEGEKETLEAEDELLVYYGAADSVICVATATVGDLIPAEYR
jgi:predicted GH43/DUF377 family glycosyl hydrolase